MSVSWSDEKWVQYRQRLQEPAEYLKSDPRIMPVRFDESDVVQETCIKAATAKDHPPDDAAIGLELAWLFKIQDHVLIDKKREHLSQGRDPRRELHEQQFQAGLDESTATFLGGLPDGCSSPSAPLREDEESQQLRAAIDRLPERERKVIRWRFLDNLGLAEIARRMSAEEAKEVTDGAVSGLIARATRRLEGLMGGEENKS